MPDAAGAQRVASPPELLRIASYNIHRCVGADGRRDPQRVAWVIRELECDTVGLQEVLGRPGPRSDARQLEYLAALTGMHPVAAVTVIAGEREYGNALLTRRRVLGVQRHDLSFGRREPRGALEVDLDVAGTTVRVFVAHLGLAARERRFQVRRLVAVLRQVPAHQPIVLLGDINEWLPRGRPLRWLHELLGTPPALRTFPVWLPLFALDRIWVRPSGALKTFTVHRSALARVASDHFPVKAVVEIHPHHAVPAPPAASSVALEQ